MKQTKRNVESRAEVSITKEVMHDESEHIKSSEGNFIQTEETNLRCQFCSNKYKTGKMLHRHNMTAKHKVYNYAICVKGSLQLVLSNNLFY